MGSQEDTVLHPRLLPPLPLKRLTPPWSQSSIFTSNARLSQFPLLSPKNEVHTSWALLWPVSLSVPL